MTKEIISDAEFGKELEEAITEDMQPTPLKPPLIRPAAAANAFGDRIPPAPPMASRGTPVGKNPYDLNKFNSPVPPHGPPAILAPQAVDGYGLLTVVLGKAYEQAAKGKGHARHAHSPVGFRPWHDQPILTNARQVGPAGPAQQVMKKAQEAVMMSARGDFDGAKAETLGIIVYAAALYVLFEEMEQVGK